MSMFAPRIITIKIPVDKIRDVIGPGGKMIRSIIERTGVKIDVEDDGRVNVASADGESALKAIGIIQELTATPELNKTYMGKVSASPISVRSSRSWRALTVCCTSPRSQTTV
jgi:polyribonucleotide nucleotidyltransferase